jgi:hypothetical protein
MTTAQLDTLLLRWHFLWIRHDRLALQQDMDGAAEVGAELVNLSAVLKDRVRRFQKRKRRGGNSFGIGI